MQVATLRALSDHCPVVLSIDEKNWGPRPTCMLKCWSDIPRYHQFVREKWQSLWVHGWGGFVLKEKLKMIKMALKEWHLTNTQNLSSRIDSLKESISLLESKGELEKHSEEEIVDFTWVISLPFFLIQG